MIISISIVKCLEKLNVPNVLIKWPNDILSCNKKIGGVLIENFFQMGNWLIRLLG